MTSCSREAEALRERGRRQREWGGRRRKHRPAERFEELADAGGGARRWAEGPARRVMVCICMTRRVAWVGLGGFVGREEGGGALEDNGHGIGGCGCVRCEAGHVVRPENILLLLDYECP